MILYLCSEKKYDVKKCLRDYMLRKKIILTDEQNEALEISKGAHGKPYFIGNVEKKTDIIEVVKFSVSHSGQYWACLMDNEEVGLDIEDVDYRVKHKLNNPKEKNYEAISKRFFTESEHEFVVKNGSDGFFEVWVRKEAFVKFTGRGLAFGMDGFSVINENGELKGKGEQINGATIQEIDFKCFCKNLKGAFCTKTLNKIEEIVEIV